MSNPNENLQTTPDQSHINEIVGYLKDDRAAIMVGSGFSINASPDFPNWKKLGNKIFEKLYNGQKPGENTHFDLLQIAEELAISKQRIAINEIIDVSIPVCPFDLELHKKLLELPWVDVFTTNYDTLLEKAADENPTLRKDRYKTIKVESALLLSRHPRIIKLHGDKDDLKHCIITQEDYRTYPHNFPIFINTVQQSLIENCFCLIGFSGDDPNFLNWLGWIRDNFGEKLPQRIFMLGINQDRPSFSWNKVLESRNIVFVDISSLPLQEIDHSIPFDNETDNQTKIKNTITPPKTNNPYYQPIKNLLIYLKEQLQTSKTEEIDLGESNAISKQEVINPSQDVVSEITGLLKWELGNYVSSPQEITEAVVKQVVEEWQTIRNNYPGWVILPYNQRVGIGSRTDLWANRIIRLLSSLSQQLAYDFVYEFAWRTNKCLYPLFQNLAIYCDKMVKDVEWRDKDANFTKWYEIALLLLREYRQDGKTSQWQEIATLIESVKNKLSHEQTSAFAYEQALQAVFSLDIPLLRQKLDEWKEIKDLPFWEAKRASLWAELGELEIAKPLLDTALATVRSQINSSVSEKRLALFSQEGCILSILQRVEVADALQKGKYDFSLVYKKYEERREFLRRYHCDLKEEQVVFESILKQEPIAPQEVIQRTDSFDIGRVNITRHYNSFFNDKGAIAGFSFLNYTEQTGIPFKLRNMNFDAESAIGATKRIKPYSFHWAFVTLIRCGDSKQFDWFFGRNVLSELNTADIDNYIAICISAVKNSISEIDKLVHSYMDKNLGAEYAHTIPEIISRLCSKCSLDSLQKIPEFVVYLYALSEKKRQVFCGINNLVSRLIDSYPKNQSKQLFDSIKMIDWNPIANDPIIEREFINPYLAFFQHFGDAVKPSHEDIDNALQKLESSEERERENGMILCFSFQDLFSEEQKQRLGELLWDEKFLDKNTGFPQSKVILRSSFLDKPTPTGINATELFKKLTLENITNKDIFNNAAWSVSANGNSVSLTGGWSIVCQEWENGFGIFSTNRVKLNVIKIKQLIDYIENYWNTNRRHLEIDKGGNTPFGSILDEFQKRFNTLSDIIAIVVIPNIAEAETNETGDIKEQLEKLLAEMETAGLSIGTAKIASLAVFPDRVENIERYIQQVFSGYNKSDVDKIIYGIYVLLVMKHNGISLDIDTQHYIAYIIDHVKFWLSPSLFSALFYLKNIVSKTPEFVDDETISILLPALGILANETNLTNKESRITESNRLVYRKTTMGLASAIFKYFEEQKKTQPSEILLWKNIAETQDEFWDIRNMWVD